MPNRNSTQSLESLRLPLASPSQYKRRVIAGIWRFQRGIVEAHLFGGSWHRPKDPSLSSCQRLLVTGGRVLVRDDNAT